MHISTALRCCGFFMKRQKRMGNPHRHTNPKGDNDENESENEMKLIYLPLDERPCNYHFAEKIAKEFDIKQSGGSDFHGYRKPDISLGKGRGELFVPAEFAENLFTCK